MSRFYVHKKKINMRYLFKKQTALMFILTFLFYYFINISDIQQIMLCEMSFDKQNLKKNTAHLGFATQNRNTTNFFQL